MNKVLNIEDRLNISKLEYIYIYIYSHQFLFLQVHKR